MSQNLIDLSISLISFNNKQLLENCLYSIYKNTKRIKFEILLVDNNSKDGTVTMVKRKFPKVKLLPSKQNLYFIKAHNLNLKKVRGRYFLVLNEDTEIFPNTLEKMITFMDKNPKIGLVSCKEIDENGEVDMTCSRFPTPLVELFESSILAKFIKKLIPFLNIDEMLKNYRYFGWNRDSIRPVDVIPGSFFMGRKEVLEKVGLFDEKLIFFYVEPDYCKRVKDAGFLVYHNGKVTISHFKAKGIAKLSPFLRYQLSEHGLLYYHRKYFGILWWIILWLSLRPNWLYWRFKNN